MVSIVASNPSYPAFPVLSFLAFVLVLIPLPWHLQAWNSGTCLYMIWTAIGCLNVFVNSIVWRGDAIDRAPIWCDISSRLIIGIAVALPASSLCINRRLYNIATVKTVSCSREHKRRAVFVDLAIGLGIPLVQMALEYVVEGHRYNILEDIGCYPAVFNTPLAYPLTVVWPTVIGLVSAVYCGLTLRAFFVRRAEFSQFISSNTTLTINRYFRLMGLATIEIALNTPLSAYFIYLNIAGGQISPWKGWADAHFDYSAVDLVPYLEWRSSFVATLSFESTRWSIVLCAFVFFAFFGFAAEARKNYRLAFWAIAKRLGFRPQDKPITSPTGYKFQQQKVVMSDAPVAKLLPIYAAYATKPHYFGSPVRGSSGRKSDGFSSSSSAPDSQDDTFYCPSTTSSTHTSSRYFHDDFAPVAHYQHPV